MVTPDALLPQNVEAERAVLGACLIDNGAIHLLDWLTPPDFFIERNGHIWAAMTTLTKKGQSADLISLSDLLGQRGQLDPIYLNQLLTDGAISSLHAETYGQIVQECAILRRLINGAGRIARIAYDRDSQDVGEMVNQAQQITMDVSIQATASPYRPLIAGMDEYLNKYDYFQANPHELEGLNFGLKEIDEMVCGVEKDDLWILGGRPGGGKTALGIDLALRVAKEGHAVGFFSLEMGLEKITQRLIANEAKVDSLKLKRYNLNDGELLQVLEADKVLSGLNILIDDTSAMTLPSIVMKARRMKREKDIKLIVIDYLQLITPENPKHLRHDQIAAISRGLKIAARQLRTPILALSQISRAVDSRASKEPELGDLSEGSGIEKDADGVLFVYTPDPDSAPNVSRVKCAKNRNGKTGIKDVFFAKEFSRFESLEFEKLEY